MDHGLTEWLSAPREHKGLRLLRDSGEWELFTYERIAAESWSVAGHLVDLGVKRDVVVAVVLGTSSQFLSTLFGTWLAGGTVCPITPQGLFEEEGAYESHIAGILETAKPTIVVADSASTGAVGKAMARAGIPGRPVKLEIGGVALRHPQETGDIGLLQFTSGSSGIPRGVRVSFRNLMANLRAMTRWVSMSADDAVATWLPLFHDMGLIGCLLTPTMSQCDIWIMRPEQFVRWPERWLSCFGRHGATITAAPNFGYGYVARKVDAQAISEMQFRNWRVAIAGAEPISVESLRAFASLLSPRGFSHQVFVPAYGLAEATLSVTGQAVGKVARAILPDPSSMRFGEKVVIGEVCDIENADRRRGWLVSCGRPHDGLQVSIVDSKGETLPDCFLGEIAVEGESVAEGYVGIDEGRTTRFEDGRLFSGDAALIAGGELFVVGRIGDSIKVRGKSVYAEDLEAALCWETSIGPGKCVVFACPGTGTSEIAAIAEMASTDWGVCAEKVLRNVVGSEVRVRVFSGKKGVIQRTSSGKPRRRLMWELLKSGSLDLQLLSTSEPADD